MPQDWPDMDAEKPVAEDEARVDRFGWGDDDTTDGEAESDEGEA